LKEEEDEMLETWQHFQETYVSYTQPSTLDFPLSEQLKSCIRFPNYVDPNASNKMEYFIGHGENISHDKIPKVDDVKKGKEKKKTIKLS
jgi:hypothetical protein